MNLVKSKLKLDSNPTKKQPLISFQRCRFTHDIPSYLSAKPKDICFSSTFEYSDTPPFVDIVKRSFVDDDGSSVDFNTVCPVFLETGECRHGLKCRFLGGHVRKGENGELILLTDEEKQARSAVSGKEVNFMSPDTLKLLRSKKVSTF